MSSCYDLIIATSILIIAVCSVGFLIAALNIAHTLRHTSDQLLDLATEGLDLFDLEEPSHQAATPSDSSPNVSNSSAAQSPLLSSREMLNRFVAENPIRPALQVSVAHVPSDSNSASPGLKRFLEPQPAFNTRRAVAQSPLVEEIKSSLGLTPPHGRRLSGPERTQRPVWTSQLLG